MNEEKMNPNQRDKHCIKPCVIPRCSIHRKVFAALLLFMSVMSYGQIDSSYNRRTIAIATIRNMSVPMFKFMVMKDQKSIAWIDTSDKLFIVDTLALIIQLVKQSEYWDTSTKKQAVGILHIKDIISYLDNNFHITNQELFVVAIKQYVLFLNKNSR